MFGFKIDQTPFEKLMNILPKLGSLSFPPISNVKLSQDVGTGHACTKNSARRTVEKKRPAASIWKNWVPWFFFCFGICAIIKHKGKLIPQAKQLPVKIDSKTSLNINKNCFPWYQTDPN